MLAFPNTTDRTFFFVCAIEARLSQANIFHYPNQTMANLIVRGPEEKPKTAEAEIKMNEGML